MGSQRVQHGLATDQQQQQDSSMKERIVFSENDSGKSIDTHLEQ